MKDSFVNCKCGHGAAYHSLIGLHPCDLCDCKSLNETPVKREETKSNYGPGHASKGDDPVKVLKPILEQMDRNYKGMQDQIEDIQLDIADLQPGAVYLDDSPTGTLILHFDHVTAAEVRTILTGALKNTDALYSINYMINNESENDNG